MPPLQLIFKSEHMRAALSKAVIESELSSRFGQEIFKLNDRGYAEVISTGLPEIDALAGGFPRGAITEIFGPDSSGRTSLMLSALAEASNSDEVCALIDTNDAFDLNSAVNATVNFDRLLWIRCSGSLEHSFKAVDLLLQGGGFGLVFLDLGDVHAKEARRIISSWWYRFRRVVENTPTALVVIAQDACARSCASLTLALESKESDWSTVCDGRLSSVRNLQPVSNNKKLHADKGSFVSHANLLRRNLTQVDRIKPIRAGTCDLHFVT